VSAARDRFTEAARVLGLHPHVHHFPEGTKTADDAARAIGCDVAQIVKSLVFMADDVPVLALTSGRNRVDTSRLAALCGAEGVRRATPEEARAATGFAVGGTPPFGHPEKIRTFVDPDLMTWEVVWAAAGTPDAVFPLAPTDLLRLSGGVVADFAERPSS
jgi:prolyl-tRNA editing enzyme YbaK/EbsC (Cys-tRNA(Pro) deacylase)